MREYIWREGRIEGRREGRRKGEGRSWLAVYLRVRCAHPGTTT